MAPRDVGESRRPPKRTLEHAAEGDTVPAAGACNERGYVGDAGHGDRAVDPGYAGGTSQEVEQRTMALETQGSSDTDSDIIMQDAEASTAGSSMAPAHHHASVPTGSSSNSSVDHSSLKGKGKGKGKERSENQDIIGNKQPDPAQFSKQELWKEFDVALKIVKDKHGMQLFTSCEQPSRSDTNPFRYTARDEREMGLPRERLRHIHPNGSDYAALQRTLLKPPSPPPAASQPRPPQPQPPSTIPLADAESFTALSSSPNQGHNTQYPTANDPSASQRLPHGQLPQSPSNTSGDTATTMPSESNQKRAAEEQNQCSRKSQKREQSQSPAQSPTQSQSARPHPTAKRSDILDRHNRAIAQILTRFRNMVMAAAAPIPRTAIIETASLNRLTMEREAAALITEVEGLLSLTREIKALWIRGPLRLPGEDDGREAQIDRQAQLVTGLYGQIVGMKNQMAAGNPAAQPQKQG